MNKSPKLLAISGVKNSGKTSLIIKIIPRLVNYGLRVATIKHDGHDFNADVPNTDSYSHKAAGAFGTAVFSSNKFLVVKDTNAASAATLAQFFPEADIIILEGFKDSSYPKIEIVRQGNSTASVCNPETLLALVTDISITIQGVPVFHLNDIDAISNLIYKWVKKN